MQSNFEKVYGYIYIYIFTKIVSLHLNFLYLLPLNPLILGSFTSTNKSTPCIRFQIEDCSFSKIQIRGKLLFIFYNFAKLESSLMKTKFFSTHFPSTIRTILLLSITFRPFATSTSKSTPCIRFVIEDPPLKKKGKIKDSFSKIQIRASFYFLQLCKT